ncbi:hypothetical protein JCM21900_003920 [Sporobolomyces salmonicolor]
MAAPSFQLTGMPIASSAGPSASGASTPAPQASRSGRIIKPVKPYTAPTQPARASSHAAARAPSSALNPNRPQPPAKHPLGTTAFPVPPMTRITQPGQEGKQAMFTTYPARMRLGTSSLMQPGALAPAGAASGAATGTSTPMGGKRQRSTVNYAELGALSDQDDDDTDEPRAKRGGSGTPGLVPKKHLAAEKDGIWGDGKSYLGSMPPGNLVTVQPAVKTKHIACTEEQLEEHAEQAAAFVPIQIDLDFKTFKIRDHFVWNVNEELITPEAFARTFCEDLDLPADQVAEVAKQIADQIEEQTGVAVFPLRSVEEEAELVEKDLRVIINLDVQIGTLHLTDRVEWDLSSSLTPELFAATLVQDLSLSSSAGPLIAHALHEELFRLKKSCIEMGLVGVDEAVMRRRGAKPLEGVWREWNEAQTYGPTVERMTLDELDRVEADRERAIRRAKRDRLTGPRAGGRRR